MQCGNNKRDKNIDNIKGIMLLFVFWGHQWLTQGISSFFPMSEIYSYLVSMPIFFVCSCLFVKQINKQNLCRRFQQILIPFAFWYFLELSHFIYNWNDILSIKFFKEYVYSLFWGNWAHLNASALWFLPACLSLNLLIGIAKINKIALYIITFISICIIFNVDWIRENMHTQIPFGIDIALYLFPIVMIIANIYHIKNKGNFKMLKLRFIIPIVIILSVIIWKIFPCQEEYWLHKIDYSQFLLPQGFLYIINFFFIYFWFEFLYSLKKIKFLTFLGENSLIFFILNLPIVKILYPITLKILNMQLNINLSFILIILIDFLTCISMPILFIKLCNKISDNFKYIGVKND